MHSPAHGGGWAPEAPLYLVGADTSARPHPSQPLHQGSWGLVLDFFVWEGPLIHSKKIMNGFSNMPVNPPQKWRSRPHFGGVTARAVPQTTAVPTLIRGGFAL